MKRLANEVVYIFSAVAAARGYSTSTIIEYQCENSALTVLEKMSTKPC